MKMILIVLLGTSPFWGLLLVMIANEVVAIRNAKRPHPNRPIMPNSCSQPNRPNRDWGDGRRGMYERLLR